MTWDAAFAGDLEASRSVPAARMPATMTELVSAEWDAAGLSTIVGLSRPYAEATGELDEAYRNATGRSADDVARERGMDLRGPRARGAFLSGLVTELPSEQQAILKPLADLDGRARQKAQAIEARAADVGSRSYGLSGATVGFLTGAVRQAVDPVNLSATILTAPLGGGFSMGIGQFLLREAAVGAATQAVQEPVIQPARADLGLESGFGPALESIAGAGIGSAGVAGLLRGGAALYRRLAQQAPAPGPIAQAEQVPLAGGREPPSRPDLSPEDLDAAARRAERDQVLDDVAHEPSAEGRVQSTAATDEAERAIEAGQSPPRTPLDPETPPPAAAQPHHRLVQVDHAELDYVRPTTGDDRAYVVERDGQRVAGVNILVEGDVAEIKDIFSLTSASPDLAKGQLGHTALAAVMRQFLAENPGVKRFSGERVSGARRPDGHGMIGSGVEVAVQVPSRRSNVPRYLSINQFIARNGGLELTGDAVAADLDKLFVPGGGRLARKRGRSIDGFWREKLIEEGYLRADDEGGVARDIREELFDAIRRDQMGDRIYTLSDMQELANADRRPTNYEREVEREARAIRKQLAHMYPDGIDEGVLYAAAERTLRGSETDMLAALDRAYIEAERRAMQSGAPPDAVRGSDVDIPFFDEVPGPRGRAEDARGTPRDDGGGGDASGPEAGSGRSREDGPDARGSARGEGGEPLLPGFTEPSGRERLEAQGSRPLRGGDAAPPAGGLFDPDAGAQTDLVQAVAAARRADVERALEAAGGDMEVTIVGPDGGETKISARELLRQTEASGRAADELHACILKGGGL